MKPTVILLSDVSERLKITYGIADTKTQDISTGLVENGIPKEIEEAYLRIKTWVLKQES